MKNLIYYLLLALIFTSCSSEEEADLIINNNDITSIQKDVGKPVVTITVSSKLHRGRKWSERNNVPHCSSSFGFCTVRVKSVKVKGVKIVIPKSQSNANDSGDLEKNLFFLG